MIIDLRSDTVTRPTPGMLDAIMQAQTGDDVYKEDPTVNALEHKMASIIFVLLVVALPHFYLQTK